MSLVFIICSVLVTLCQIQYSFGQQQNQDLVDKGMAAANVDLNLNVAPEAEIPTTEANMPDALNETDIVLITNNTNETIAVSNNGTAGEEIDEEYEDEDGGSLTTDIPDLSTPSPEVPPPSWAPGGNPQIDLRLEDFCLCDLKIGFCDVNCCCDEDCDSEDRKVFSHCQERPHPVLDSKYCFQEHLIFSNHTEYSVEYTHSGAFCIITDNLPQRTTYQLVKGATNLEEYKSLQKKRRYYSWMSNQKEKPATLDPYSDGTLVWGVDENGVTFPLGIPVSVVGSECESVTSAVYLKDVESSCNQMLHNLGSECESNMYLDAVEYLAFYVIADPRNLFQQNRSTETTTEPTTTVESTGEESSGDIGNDASVEMSPQFPNKTNEEEEENAKNLTNVQSERQLRRLISLGDSIEKLSDLSDIHPDQLVSIRTYLCQLESKEEVKEDEEKKKGREEGRRNEMYKATGETDEICVEKNIIDIPQPIYNSGVCSNVLLSIDYIFIHNGSEGLFDIQAKVYLTSVPDVSTHTKQRFSIKYLWASTEEKTVFERSGRPGYITGKPLLMGKLIENRTEDDIVKEAINLDTDPRHWMTILSPGSTGKCDSFSQVTFGVDMRSGCSFQVTQEDFTQDCNLVQEKILRLLLGPIPLNGERLRIASFGDSSVNNPPDWVPILVPEEPHCGTSSKLFGITRHYDLITSLHIEVAYSLQGSLGNPQPKVVGVALRYGEPRETRFPCSNAVCQLNSKMTTSEVELMSSVSFVDVTRPPLPAYSQPPALDLKLPYDFFYPFLPSSASSCLQMYCIKLCVATSLLVLYSFYAVPTLVSFSLA